MFHAASVIKNVLWELLLMNIKAVYCRPLTVFSVENVYLHVLKRLFLNEIIACGTDTVLQLGIVCTVGQAVI